MAEDKKRRGLIRRALGVGSEAHAALSLLLALPALATGTFAFLVVWGAKVLGLVTNFWPVALYVTISVTFGVLGLAYLLRVTLLPRQPALAPATPLRGGFSLDNLAEQNRTYYEAKIQTLKDEIEAKKRESGEQTMLLQQVAQKLASATESVEGLKVKVEFLERKAHLAEMSERNLKGQLDAKELEVQEQAEQVAVWRHQWQSTSTDRDQWYQIYRYGEALRKFANDLAAADEHVIRNKMDEFRTVLSGMIEPAYKVWRRVGEDMQADGTESHAFHHWRWVESQFCDQLGIAHSDLLNVLDSSGGDPRSLFLLTFKAYWRFRSWVGRCIQVRKLVVEGWPEFTEWQKGTAEFNQEFRRIVGTKQSEGMKLLREVQRELYQVYHHPEIPSVSRMPAGPFASHDGSA